MGVAGGREDHPVGAWSGGLSIYSRPEMDHLPGLEPSYSGGELEQLAARGAALCAAPGCAVTASWRVVASYPMGVDLAEPFASSATPGVDDRVLRHGTESERLTLRVLARQAALEQRDRELAEKVRIAAVGRWRSELATGVLRWSPMVFEIFGIPPEMPLTYSKFLGGYTRRTGTTRRRKNGRYQGRGCTGSTGFAVRTAAYVGCWGAES